MNLWHEIAPYLTDGKSAIAAILANRPYPARDLLITLVFLAGIAWLIARVVKALSKK
jgi:hypothetical protein